MTTTNLRALHIGLPISSLDAYIEKVNQIPILSAVEEKTLAERLQQNNDLQAAQQLILPHLRFVVRIARTYAGYGLAMADLIQEGNIGLMKAVKRFDPAMGVRLVSFAVHWIKAEIQEFVLRNWRLVKIATTKAQRKLFFNLRKAKKQLNWFSQEEVHAVAKDLDVHPHTVREMETRLASRDISFDVGANEEDEQTDVYIPALYLEDHRYDPARQLEAFDHTEQSTDNLRRALETLDERSQHIVTTRWLAESKATLRELAEYFQISIERVRQLEQNAMKKLRDAMTTA